MGLGSIVGGIFGGGDSPQPMPLSEEEKRIIGMMEELAKGDEELGQMYVDFTKRALKGEVANPYVEAQLAREEEEIKQRVSELHGSVGDIASTGGRETLARQREGANLVRAASNREDIRTGEGLISSLYGRRIGAGTAALAPRSEMRRMQYDADVRESEQGSPFAEMLGGGVGGYIAGTALGVSNPWAAAALGASGGGGLIPGMKKKKGVAN